MLTYSLEERGDLPLYDYLSRRIKEDIWAGVLKPGEKLPSKRALARNLEVSVVTVENAYAQLVAEGYLYTREKSGYFVSALETGARPAPARTMPLPEEPEGEWLLDLRSGGSGTEGFPFAVWARLLRRVISDEGERLLKVSPHSGVPELRQAIVGYLRQFRGIDVSPEQVVVGAGTEYLYNLIVQLLGRDKVFGLEQPGYPKAGKVYALNGAKCVPLTMDEQGVRVESVEDSGAQVIHLSPSHQFPSGVVTPIARRQSLLRWAQKGEGRYIIEDDYDSELRLGGKPIPTLQSIDISEKVIYMNTFTKTLASTVRISYMILPRPLLEQFYQKLSFYSCTVSNFEQYTLDLFIKEGYFEKHINRLRNYYQNKKNGFLSAIWDSGLHKCVEISGEEAGVHFLMKLKTEKAEENVIELAKAQGIKLSPLSKFYYEKKAGIENTYVMNYSSVDMERIGKIVRGLEKIC